MVKKGDSELNKPVFSQICCYIVAKHFLCDKKYSCKPLIPNDLRRFLAEDPGFELEASERFSVPMRIKQCHKTALF
jgi:hypothetical protein